MARAPYKPVELSEALKPVAAPVDSFVHAQEPSRDTNLQDLARSLSGLGGSLQGLVGARDKQAEEDDAIRGEAAFHQNNQQGYAEGVASGAIPAQASKQFMQAYKKAQGEVAGGQLEQKFAAAYESWEGKSSTDPKAYDAFVGSFIKDSISTQDPDILRGLLPKIRQVTTNYLQRHIGDASKATMQGAITASVAQSTQAIDAANSAGLSSKQGTDYEGVFSTIEGNRASMLKSGGNREQYDKEVVDAVTAASITHRDPKILDFFNRKVPGQEYTWGNTPYGRDQKQKTIDTLEAMGRKSIADDEKKNREEKSALKDDVTRRTIQAITAKPNDPIPEDLLAAGEKVDPDFRVNAIRWRDTIGKGTQTSDNEELTRVTREILFEGGGAQAVQKAMNRGVFKNPEDLTRAYKLAEGMQTTGPKLEEMLKVGTAKTILDTLKKQTATEKDSSKILFDDGSMSREGLQSTSDYKQALMEWLLENPNASSMEREKAAQSIGATFLDRIKQPDGPMSPTFYDREGVPGSNTFGSKSPPKQMPAEAAPPQPAKPPSRGPTFGNPSVEVPSGLPGVNDTAPTPAPKAPAAPVQQADPEAASAWFNGLPQETRSALEMRAAQEKKPLSLKVQELYQKGIEKGAIQAPAPVPGRQTMRAPDGTPIEAASVSQEIGQAFEEAQDAPASADTIKLIGDAFERALGGSAKPQGNYTLAVLKDNPKAARILDFVAGPESRGNYNAYYGNTNSTKDLSKMTLAELKGWMGNRGTKSSATGRYQFMKGTLFGDPKKPGDTGLVGAAGLSMSTRFTPELQDQLAMKLLERRGFLRWQAGTMSDAQFANNLALEWASLPNITAQNGRPAGVSAYANDGLNKSLVSPAQVMAALTGSAAMPGATIQQAAVQTPVRTGILGMFANLFRRKPTTRV